MNRKLFFLLLCLPPLQASASVLLGVCDHQSYQVVVRNGGSEHIVHLDGTRGEIEEFGPMVSFQIKNPPDVKEIQPVITATSPDSEFCIWSGKIKIQRLNRINDRGVRN